LGLHTDLFVKFSRDFDNPARDRAKTQMEPEVRFASLSRAPGFPIAVPAVQFADYDRTTGTGILITERIRLGTNGIERQYHKCLDYEMPEPLDHYRALLTALARVAGTHRSGRLPGHLTAHFPLDVRAAIVGERPQLCADKLDRRLSQLAHLSNPILGCCPRTPAHQSSWRGYAKTCRASHTTGTPLHACSRPTPTTSRCAIGTPTSTTRGSGGMPTACSGAA